VPYARFLRRWGILAAIGVVVATICWKAFGWFSSFGRALLAAIVWSLAVALWDVIRQRRRQRGPL